MGSLKVTKWQPFSYGLVISGSVKVTKWQPFSYGLIISGSVKVTEWQPFSYGLIISGSVDHSVNCMFSLYYVFFFVFLFISHFDFEDRSLAPIVTVTGNCLYFVMNKTPS